MRELPTLQEEFDSNCVYVIWYHDFLQSREASGEMRVLNR